AAGPSCDALHDAVVVTLLVLLDEDRAPSPETTASSAAPDATAPPAMPASAAEPAVPASKAPVAPIPVAYEAAPPVVPRRSGVPVSLWLSFAGALTHSMPLDWSGALLFDLSVRAGAFEASAGGLWAPTRHVVTAPGEVAVSVFGERVRGCYAVEPLAKS